MVQPNKTLWRTLGRYRRAILLVVLCGIGCSNPSAADLLWIELPSVIGALHKEGTHEYEEAASGYSVRYLNEEQLDWVDVYIYPVADKASHLSHKQRVAAYLDAAQREIDWAVLAGHYTRQEQLGVEAYEIGGRQLLRSRHQIQANGQPYYSLIYITEANGTIIKLRVSVAGTTEAVAHEAYEREAFGLVGIMLKALDEYGLSLDH